MLDKCKVDNFLKIHHIEHVNWLNLVPETNQVCGLCSLKAYNLTYKL